MTQRPSLFVAAIDLGTTMSGYAFSSRFDFERNPLLVATSSWHTSSVLSLKTPSCVLFRPNGQFDSFGYEAEDRYTELADEEQHQGWFFFRRFKTMLFNTVGVNRKMKIADTEGKEMPAVDVFAAAITYLKDHFLQRLRERTVGIELDDIKWVLTVPAVWNDSAKQFLRESAQKASICSDRLALVLESDAAAMYWKYLPLDRAVENSASKISCFQPNSICLVLDAGGETVDITVHVVSPSGKLKEIQKATGGPWGSSSIDRAFLDFIQNLTGRKVMDQLEREHAADYMDLRRELEMKKKTVNPDRDSRISLRMPSVLHELYHNETGKRFKEAIGEIDEGKGRVSLIIDRMRIDGKFAQSLFDQTCKQIIDLLHSVLQERATADTTILMVGGFSESPMLQAAVQRAFPNNGVVVPEEPVLAILKGAVIFGHDTC